MLMMWFCWLPTLMLCIKCYMYVCMSFADEYGLRFNPTNTQLICFTRSHSHLPPNTPLILVVCHFLVWLQFATSATFGPMISVTLLTWLVRLKACLRPSHVHNCSLKVIYSFCLSLYGASLWCIKV